MCCLCQFLILSGLDDGRNGNFKEKIQNYTEESTEIYQNFENGPRILPQQRGGRNSL